MRTDTSHRSDLLAYATEEYETLADRCVLQLSQIADVSSVVLCGSLAKGDLVPGWSDIDIIVFLGSDRSGMSVLSAIKESMQTAKGTMRVGIGLDIVYEAQFLSSHKLCGRPYMMTYEVAGYGQVRYGNNPFCGIIYDSNAQKRVAAERPQLIAAELHNWRREYILREDSTPPSVNWLFTCAKAFLRILQLETGPNLTPPISSRGSLDRFRLSNPDHLANQAFTAAVQIRQEWPKFLAHAESFDDLTMLLTHTINFYPVHFPRV